MKIYGLELADKIKVYFLPAYSPDLNAAEWIWRHSKREFTHNKYFETKPELRCTVRKGFNRLQGNPGSLRSAVQSFCLPAGQKAG